MMSSTKPKLRTRVQQIADRLAEVPTVDAVCLFGSVARGDETDWSDIDFLVVGRDPKIRPSMLLRKLPRELSDERVSILYYTPKELRGMAAAGTSFIAHLRREGAILHDASGLLTRTLRQDPGSPVLVDEELDTRLAQLAIYEDPTLFKGNFLFALARVYAIAKSLVMLDLAAEGADEFRRDAAFERFKIKHPQLADEVDVVARLRPFFRLVTRRGTEPLPFSYHGAERQLTKAVRATRKLSSALR